MIVQVISFIASGAAGGFAAVALFRKPYLKNTDYKERWMSAIQLLGSSGQLTASQIAQITPAPRTIQPLSDLRAALAKDRLAKAGRTIARRSIHRAEWRWRFFVLVHRSDITFEEFVLFKTERVCALVGSFLFSRFIMVELARTAEVSLQRALRSRFGSDCFVHAWVNSAPPAPIWRTGWSVSKSAQ
jgi:hypothetical protein